MWKKLVSDASAAGDDAVDDVAVAAVVGVAAAAAAVVDADVADFRRYFPSDLLKDYCVGDNTKTD